MTAGSVARAGGAGGRFSRSTDFLRRQFVPGGGPRTRPLEAALVFVIAAVLAFFRLGSAAVHARVWAEDGKIFLHEAATDGPIRSFTIAYAGYLHGAPRVSAAVVYPFPVRWWGAGLHVVDSLFVAGVGLMIYVGLSDHLHSRLGRSLAALYVVIVPVGPEITGSIANLQWYLVVGAVVSLFWTPNTRWGWAAICVTTVAAVTSSPLGAIVFALAVVRLVLQRNRGSLVVLVATTLGYAAQVVEMVHAPQRKFASLYSHYGAAGIARGYLRRVVGDGVLGMDRLLPTAIGTSVVAGTVVLSGLALVVLLGIARRWPGTWAAALLLAVASVASFLVALLFQPVALPTDNGVIGGRYFATSAMFLVLALIVLGGGLLERRVAAFRAPGSQASVPEKAARSILLVAVLALVGGLAFGLVTTYDEAQLRGRDSTITWSHAVKVAARQCRAAPQRDHVDVPTLPNPAVWFVRLPCSTLRDR